MVVCHCCCSITQSCPLLVTPWTAACKASLSFTTSQSLLKLMSVVLVMPPTISSSVVPFSSCLQFSPASGSFPMNQFFTSSGQSIRASASASVLPMNIQDWFLLGWTGWIYLQSKGLSKVQTTWPASWEICMQVRKQQLELDMEQQTGSKSERSTTRLYIVTLLI